jgi:hypothetical protein
MDLAREEEIRLVKDEYNRFISSYDHDSFVLNCKMRSRLLIEDHQDGARFIADEAIRALGCSKPLLMVRVGDAEANLLRFARHRNEFELKWVNAVLLMNDNQTLPIEDAQRLSCELSEVLAGADIIGLRAFGPNPSDVHIRKISQAIDKRNLRGALGMIEALQYADRAVKKRRVSQYGPDKRVGSSWLVGASRRSSRQSAARRRDHRPARTRNALFGEVEKSAYGVSADTGASDRSIVA